jgi:hypothetical protein
MALDARGSVTPGIDGIRGGMLRPRGLLFVLPVLVGVAQAMAASWLRTAAV